MSKDNDESTVDPTMLKRLVGILIYLTITTPYIMYGLSLISRFMESPKDSHWKVGKRIMRYVSGKRNLALCIQPQKISKSLHTMTITMETS